ncbi:MAG: 16S rRNA (cytosine(1402)-N(4))-methyltransferase RsmH [Pseudomonadota bacterium]
MAAAAQTLEPTPHIPVLIDSILDAVGPVRGTWIDGTYGAGGYTRRLLDAGAEHVIAIDRDPKVFENTSEQDALTLHEGTFGDMEDATDGPVDGVVLDLGVSSMQLDQPERGFSFLRDGPLDMRMGATGPLAADLVNTAEEKDLADILFHFGEERASRRIAKAIVAARPINTTARLAEVIEGALPPRKPGQSHPATRSFQAIRIAVNDEFGELVRGLDAAERLLKEGGHLAVVSFHSLEDRIVKRFFQQGTGGTKGSRHAPETQQVAPRWKARNKGLIASDAEVAKNPRARSATLRVGVRTAEPAKPANRAALGLSQGVTV